MRGTMNWLRSNNETSLKAHRIDHPKRISGFSRLVPQVTHHRRWCKRALAKATDVVVKRFQRNPAQTWGGIKAQLWKEGADIPYDRLDELRSK